MCPDIGLHDVWPSIPSFQLVDDAEVEFLPPPTWLVDSVLPANSVCLLYGAPGCGKTFVALDLAMHVSSAKPWLGNSVAKGGVLYVLAEGSQGLRQRMRAWKAANNYPGRTGVRFRCEPIDALKPGGVDLLLQAAPPGGLALVIIDTLARCMTGGDEDSAKDMGLFVAAADRIRKTLHCTVLIVHHPTKTRKVERGSGALRGAADTVIRLEASGQELRMVCEKQKDAAVFQPLSLRLAPLQLPDGSTSCVVVPIAPSDSNVLQAPLVNALAELAKFPQGRASATQWREALDSKPKTFDNWRKSLLAHEYIASLGHHHYQITETGKAALEKASATATPLPMHSHGTGP